MIEPIKVDPMKIETRTSTHKITFGGAALAVTAADKLDVTRRKTRAGSRVSVFRSGEGDYRATIQ